MSVTSPTAVLLEGLHARFGPRLAQLPRRGNGQWHFRVAAEDLREVATTLLAEHEARYGMLVGSDDRPSGGGFTLHHVFSLGRQRAQLVLETPIAPENPQFPSLAAHMPAANWAEREVQDLLGLVPTGHPDPRRLVLHENWPAGVYPLRHDFDPARVGPPEATMPEMALVEGPGVCEVPVGPIHAGVIEPGHFRFSVDGEFIIQLEARLGWTHRGLEKKAEGKRVEHVLALAERMCGACSLTNALAYCQALEAIAGIQVPERALYLRVIACELERMYNHVGDVGGILTDVAYTVGNAHALRLRETLLQLNEALFGHRLLMGTVVPGGLARDASSEVLQRLRGLLPLLRRDFADLVEIASHNESVLDRLETTGTVSAALAYDLALVGPAARATGSHRDVRRDLPYAAYDRLDFQVAHDHHGDVLARFKVKAAEFMTSLSLIEQSLAKLADGPVAAPLGVLPAGAWAVGAVEGPRGENLAFVKIDERGAIARYKVRTSSFMNWPAVQLAVIGNIVPDFPLINKSFNLCYSCTDR